MSIAGFGTDDLVRAASAQAQNLAELLAQRSPGERTEATLSKHKPAERALSRIRPPVPATDQGVVASAPPPAEDLATIVGGLSPVAPVDFAAIPAIPPIGAAPPLAAVVGPGPGGGGGILPPGGGIPPEGGGPATFPTPQPEIPVDTPSAVPEPGTWAMMLMGFGLMGWRIRRGGKAFGVGARA